MNSVVDFILDLIANDNLKLQGLDVGHVECRIENLRHHPISKREPNFRSERRRRSKPILRCRGPMRIRALPQRHVANKQNQK